MFTLAENRQLKFTNFFLLYFLQGWTAGFTGTALLNHMASTGTTVGTLGRFSFIIGIPWIIQALWSPLIDRFPGLAMGKRRAWLVLAAVPANFILMSLFFVPFSPFILASVFLAHSFCCSIMDTAVDGMMVDLVKQEESGFASAITNGGSVIGSCLSALVFSYLLTTVSFQANVALLVSVSVLVTLFSISIRERKEDRFLSIGTSNSAPIKKIPTSTFLLLLGGRMRNPKAIGVLILSFGVFFLFSCVSLTYNAKLLSSGAWTSVELSRYQSLLGLVSATLGALTIGKLCDRIGDQLVFAAGLLIAGIFFGAMTIAPNASALSYLTFLTIAPGLLFVALVPRVMLVSRGAVAATSFTLCMTMMNFGSLAGGALSDSIFSILDQATVFSIESSLFLIGSLAVATPVVRGVFSARLYAKASAPNPQPSTI